MMQKTSQDLTPHTRLKKAWLITALLMIFQMINFADKAVLGLVAESAMAELQMTSTEFGFIGSSFFFYLQYLVLLLVLLQEKFKPNGLFWSWASVGLFYNFQCYLEVVQWRF